MIRFRSPKPADAALLSRLFASAVPERQFLPPELTIMQERFQRQQWTQHWGAGGETIVELDGVPAARIWLAWGPGTLRLVDLTVLPEFRGRGLGRRLVSGLCDAADTVQGALHLTVRQDNSVARTLYESLGFHASEAQPSETYTAMIRSFTPAPESPQDRPTAAGCRS